MRAKAVAMAEILRFDRTQLQPVSVTERTRHPAPSDVDYSFWPDVSQGLWAVSDPQPVDPANSENRVLSEMILILGVAAAVAVAVSFFVGAPAV